MQLEYPVLCQLDRMMIYSPPPPQKKKKKKNWDFIRMS